MIDPGKPVIVEQLYNTPVSMVWEAITEPDRMRQWFFDNIPAFEPRVGFRTRFVVRSGDRTFTHVWEIIEVVPGNKIAYRWSYEEYDGTGYVSFELSGKDETALLRLTNEGLESFPRNIPEFSRESCNAGWEYFIRQRLKDYLDTISGKE